MTRIVVLDGYTLNPGDLSWQGLEALGDCRVYDRTSTEELPDRAKDAEVLLTNKTVLARETIARLPRLRYIGVLATGYNVVDVAAARERGVLVTNVPTYGTRSVAQMTMAHLLNLTERVGHHARSVADGRWARSPDWCYWDYPLVELQGLVMGIVGLGRIGRAVADLAVAFGMEVLAYDVNPPGSLPGLKTGTGSEPACVKGLDDGPRRGACPLLETIRLVGLDELFRTSDVVSLHCPLTPQTSGLVDARRLASMKRTAFLINTSRGPLVDEPALAEALVAGRIAGAGLDVLTTEPPAADNPLLRAPNCYVTPHVAWATKAARQRLLDAAVENVKAFLAGNLRNVVE